jgi:hypothetical protein
MVFLLRSVGRYAGLAACSLVFAASCVFGQAAHPTLKNLPAQKTLLPARFSGWVEQGASQIGTAPTAADPVNADVLAEYGLKAFAEGTYHRGTAVVNLRAMLFSDATGAYGAFTFYRKPDMKSEAIGKAGARNAREVVFWSGTTVVDASFGSSRPPARSALKALAVALPPAAGSSGVAPSLPNYLPAESLDKATVRYAIGPAAYAQGGGVLPPGAIDFSRDAEVVTAQYVAHDGRGTLTLIEYPTPQMAIRAEKTLGTLLKGALPATLQRSSPAVLGVHRSGPVVAVTSGQFTSAESQALLGEVKYQAEVTWSRPGSGESEVRKAAEMLMGIAYLTAILIACSLLLAAMLGGGRALLRTVRGKPASSVYEEDFISLNLSGWQAGPPRKLP